MTDRSVRRYLTPVCATAIAAGVVLSGAPASAATTTTPFAAQCRAAALLTVDKAAQHAFTVDAPGRVEPGETFTYRVQPAPSAYPDKDTGATTTNVSRMKLDYQLPENAQFVDAKVVQGSGIGISGTPANVLLVNENGDPDPDGTILRLSGDNEVIGNSPKADKKSVAGIVAEKTKAYLDGTPSADGSTWFQLPAIDVTLTAGAGGEITPKLRTSGGAANLGNEGNYNTFLALAVFGGNQWAPTRCVPKDAKEDSAPLNRGGGPLATIAVGEQTGNVTATEVTAPETAKAGEQVSLSATVAPAPNGGNVAFLVDNIVVGEAPVVDGTATFTYAFDRGGEHKVAARYIGNGTFRPSLSADATVTVEGGGSGSAIGSVELPSLGSLQLPFGS
ncbi:Ig-like domain repeat protein [Prescottella agglutinans]|uniref:Ig-like domain repeat protein n=1 Tax=Prescottella agglutinans TaxID=1644129 RepID=A0A438BG88_9NOCA|nr:Ig-like domain-containing protein [Prescottella agglutinans]RVW10007.1 Ig-like domain repeat protein [Prescottella agglutinans]